VQNSCRLIRFTEKGTMNASALTALLRPFERLRGVMPRLFAIVFAISRQFAHAMGSDIEVESEAGEGSVFSLELPAVSQAGAQNGIQAGTQRGAQNAVQTADQTGIHAAVGGVRHWAEAAAASNARFAPFSAAVEALAQGYRSKQLLAFVERHLGAGGES
jgi:hypothetical protein